MSVSTHLRYWDHLRARTGLLITQTSRSFKDDFNLVTSRSFLGIRGSVRAWRLQALKKPHVF